MTEPRQRTRRAFACAVAGAVLGVAGAPSPAHAAPLKVEGPAKVVSVDGPGLLTLKVGRRTVPVRLTGIDVPAANECGGTQATEALRGFVARAPKPLAYALRDQGRRRYERGADGRFVAHVSYAVRRRARDLASDLIRAGWARGGEPTSLDAPLVRRAALPDDTPFDTRRDWLGAGSSPGLQGACGGLFHLPAGAPVPGSAAAPWTVDEFGVTQAIGSLRLSATLSPGETLTMRRLAALVPMELTGQLYGLCVGFVPSLQITAWSVELQDQRCGDVTVGSIRSTGPGLAPIVRGGKVGDPVTSLRTAFPRLDLDSTPGAAWLSGDPDRQWAWQTVAEYEDNEDRPPGQVLALNTIQAPSGPDTP